MTSPGVVQPPHTTLLSLRRTKTVRALKGLDNSPTTKGTVRRAGLPLGDGLSLGGTKPSRQILAIARARQARQHFCTLAGNCWLNKMSFDSGLRMCRLQRGKFDFKLGTICGESNNETNKIVIAVGWPLWAVAHG